MIYVVYWLSPMDGGFAAAMLDSPYSSVLGDCTNCNESEWLVPGTDHEDPFNSH